MSQRKLFLAAVYIEVLLFAWWWHAPTPPKLKPRILSANDLAIKVPGVLYDDELGMVTSGFFTWPTNIGETCSSGMVGSNDTFVTNYVRPAQEMK